MLLYSSCDWSGGTLEPQPTAVSAGVFILNRRYINMKSLYSSFFPRVNLHLSVFNKNNLVVLEECSFTQQKKD